jgi:DNA-binding transcriptional regulator YdaS (Cro superfamily)
MKTENSEKQQMQAALSMAIERFDGLAGIAELLGVSRQAVQQWTQRGIPAERARQLECVTGGKITRESLRPDVYAACRLTKKSRKDRVRQIIDSYEFDVPFSQEHVDELSKLTGVCLTEVQRKFNEQYPSDPRHLRVRYCGIDAANDDPMVDDEGLTPFSWNKAISPPKALTEAKKVMRDAIKSDLKEFREAVDPACEACGATEDLCADHLYPFDAIVDEFIEQHGMPELKDGPPGAGKVIADEAWHDAWVLFHTERAVYQLLCRSCNASKGVSL